MISRRCAPRKFRHVLFEEIPDEVYSPEFSEQHSVRSDLQVTISRGFKLVRVKSFINNSPANSVHKSWKGVSPKFSEFSAVFVRGSPEIKPLFSCVYKMNSINFNPRTSFSAERIDTLTFLK